MLKSKSTLSKINTFISDNKNIIYICAVCFLIAFGVFIRCFKFVDIPGGINQDEAFAGYNAYSLLHFGKDTSGYTNPIYFITWGSGMNALEIYLMIPFVAIFGLNLFAIRLPMLIISCIAIFVFYKFATKLFGKKIGFFALGLFVICPWHIIMSRWGIESNLAPSFLLFATYFFFLGLEKRKYFIFSAIMYGLCLYAYAVTWTFIPFLILFQIIYCARHKKIKIFSPYIISFCLILFIFAIPLLLFLAINKNLMNEIITPWFSIPKLSVMRETAVSFNFVPYNLVNIVTLIIGQKDLSACISDNYGLYYSFSGYIFLVGTICLIVRLIKTRKKFSLTSLFTISFLTVFVLLILLVGASIIHYNCLFIFNIVVIVYGLIYIKKFAKFLLIKGLFQTESEANTKPAKHKIKTFTTIISLVFIFYYVVSFGMFYSSFFTSYNNNRNNNYFFDVEDAFSYAKSITDGPIYCRFYYPLVLFYDKTNVNEYLDTVKMANDPSKFMFPDSFTRYRFIYSKKDKQDIKKENENGNEFDFKYYFSIEQVNSSNDVYILSKTSIKEEEIERNYKPLGDYYVIY